MVSSTNLPDVVNILVGVIDILRVKDQIPGYEKLWESFVNYQDFFQIKIAPLFLSLCHWWWVTIQEN